MVRPALEVADIFRGHGPAWRQANAGHVSLGQLKVMSAIERCRTAALGGHVVRCEDCAYTTIAYNSCRNRHCPKCQGAAARAWLAERQAELLPVPYFHVVFTLPARIAAIAYQNKAAVYDLLFKAAAETVLTIAADPKHLGACTGITAVLHTWGSTMTHHPHVHMIVPGGGISLDGSCWVSCRPRFLLPVPVFSKLFRGLMLQKLLAAHKAGQLQFFGQHTHLAERKAFAAYLAPLRKRKWYVYSKPPFGGPKAVLAYLSRYTHRVAISNRRLIACDERGVTFKYKDYRADGRARYKLMTLATGEFIRRFLSHVLPKGFHRIRHYGLFAKSSCADNIAQARKLLAIPAASRALNHRRQPFPSGSIPHDNEHWIATAQGRLRLPPVRNRLRVRSPKCAEPPSKQASNNRPQRPSPPSNRATIDHQSRHCSRPDALRSFACTLRVSKIPIAGRAAPPRTIARGFVLWRLSDAGHRALGFSCIAGIRNPAHCTLGARDIGGPGTWLRPRNPRCAQRIERPRAAAIGEQHEQAAGDGEILFEMQELVAIAELGVKENRGGEAKAREEERGNAGVVAAKDE